MFLAQLLIVEPVLLLLLLLPPNIPDPGRDPSLPYPYPKLTHTLALSLKLLTVTLPVTAGVPAGDGDGRRDRVLQGRRGGRRAAVPLRAREEVQRPPAAPLGRLRRQRALQHRARPREVRGLAVLCCAVLCMPQQSRVWIFCVRLSWSSEARGSTAVHVRVVVEVQSSPP